ncbi:hypothetical protein ACS0TY_015258 [Phlomoides rotata]
MAIKIALAAALLVALVALARATTYTTIVTTIDDENNPKQQCKQMVQGRQFQACQQYLRHGSQYQEGTGMRGVYPIWDEQQVKDECCRSLRNLENQGCECEGIQQAAMKAQQQMGQGQQSEQVYQRAQQLPQTCNLKTQQCQNKVPKQQCKQMVQGRQFQECQQYLRHGSQSQEGIEMRGVSRDEEQVKEECCRSLKNLENQGCECEGIQQAAMKAQQQMGRGQQSEQVYQRAQQLPQTCNLKTQKCQFNVIFV